MSRVQRCPECGSTEGVRQVVDITRTWDGEKWADSDEEVRFDCFDCDAENIEPEEVENENET